MPVPLSLSTGMPMSSSSSWQALGRLLRYARGYRPRILAAVACSAINKLFDIAPEILIGIAIDVVVNQEASFIASFGFVEAREQIMALGVLTFLIWREGVRFVWVGC